MCCEFLEYFKLPPNFERCKLLRAGRPTAQAVEHVPRREEGQIAEDVQRIGQELPRQPPLSVPESSGALSPEPTTTKEPAPTTPKEPAPTAPKEPAPTVPKKGKDLIHLYIQDEWKKDESMSPSEIVEKDVFLSDCTDLNAATRTGKWAGIKQSIEEDFRWKREKADPSTDVIVKLFKIPGTTRGAAKKWKDGYVYNSWFNWSDQEIDDLVSSGKRRGAKKRT